MDGEEFCNAVVFARVKIDAKDRFPVKTEMNTTVVNPQYTHAESAIIASETAAVSAAANAASLKDSFKDIVDRYANASYSMGFTNGFIMGLSGGVFAALYLIRSKQG